MNPTRKRAVIVLIIITAFLLTHIVISTGKVMEERATLYAENDPDQDFTSILIKSLLPKRAALEGRVFVGWPDAETTLAFYGSPSSEASYLFLRELYPLLEDEYIATGKLRFYPKHHVSLEDFRNGGEKYLYAVGLTCYNLLGGDEYFSFYLDSFDTDRASGLPMLAEQHGVGSQEMRDCMDGSPDAWVRQDTQETEDFGMEAVVPFLVIGIQGRQPTIVEGVPTYQRLNRTIRSRLIQLGG